MKTLILTVGLPRSGKSTWAKKTGIPMVNPDSVRLALHGKPFIKESELMVWVIVEYMIESLFISGHDNVILDATNTTEERRQKWNSNKWDTQYKLFKTPKHICIQRANGNDVLIGIIEKMSKQIEFPEKKLFKKQKNDR